MCILLTSVEPERVFSHVNIVINKFRNRLSIETANQLRVIFVSRCARPRKCFEFSTGPFLISKV